MAADLLTGKANPSGKLPLTIPAKIEDTPAMAPGHPERYDGIADKKQVIFSEGIFIGYRWYDQQKIEPLYPFGFGLSYTTFDYSNLNVTPADGGFDVTFTLRNTGKVAGTETAQVYLGPPPNEPVPMAVHALAGFQRVTLAPGESRAVKIHATSRQVSYWSHEKGQWVIAGGTRPVFVGSSSRDLRLTGSVQIANNGQPENAPKPGIAALTDSDTGRLPH